MDCDHRLSRTFIQLEFLDPISHFKFIEECELKGIRLVACKEEENKVGIEFTDFLWQNSFSNYFYNSWRNQVKGLTEVWEKDGDEVVLVGEVSREMKDYLLNYEISLQTGEIINRESGGGVVSNTSVYTSLFILFGFISGGTNPNQSLTSLALGMFRRGYFCRFESYFYLSQDSPDIDQITKVFRFGRERIKNMIKVIKSYYEDCSD